MLLSSNNVRNNYRVVIKLYVNILSLVRRAQHWRHSVYTLCGKRFKILYICVIFFLELKQYRGIVNLLLPVSLENNYGTSNKVRLLKCNKEVDLKHVYKFYIIRILYTCQLLYA